jgi:hypothetical protein
MFLNKLNYNIKQKQLMRVLRSDGASVANNRPGRDVHRHLFEALNTNLFSSRSFLFDINTKQLSGVSSTDHTVNLSINTVEKLDKDIVKKIGYMKPKELRTVLGCQPKSFKNFLTGVREVQPDINDIVFLKGTYYIWVSDEKKIQEENYYTFILYYNNNQNILMYSTLLYFRPILKQFATSPELFFVQGKFNNNDEVINISFNFLKASDSFHPRYLDYKKSFTAKFRHLNNTNYNNVAFTRFVEEVV